MVKSKISIALILNIDGQNIYYDLHGIKRDTKLGDLYIVKYQNLVEILVYKHRDEVLNSFWTKERSKRYRIICLRLNH